MKRLWAYLATPWYRLRPLSRRHRSREAWLEHCAKTDKSPDGVKR